MNIDNITPSILKVTASEKVDVSSDLHQPESSKSLEQLLNEEEENQEKSEKTD